MNKISKKMKELIMKLNINIWSLKKLLTIMKNVNLKLNCIKKKKKNMKIKLEIYKEK